MRRTPIVITATVAGLIGVLEFHTRPAAAGIGTIPAASPAAASPASTAPTGEHGQRQAEARPGRPAGTRTAVGPAVNYS